MFMHKLTDDLYVSPQIDVAVLEALKARGIRAIVNNRPDGEQADQPANAHLQAAAKAHGIAYRHIPVVAGQIGDDQVAAFADALRDLPKPALAFCRSGTRSATLWALASAARLGVDDVLRRASDAGYDLSGMATALAAHQSKGE